MGRCSPSKLMVVWVTRGAASPTLGPGFSWKPGMAAALQRHETKQEESLERVRRRWGGDERLCDGLVQLNFFSDKKMIKKGN